MCVLTFAIGLRFVIVCAGCVGDRALCVEGECFCMGAVVFLFALWFVGIGG